MAGRAHIGTFTPSLQEIKEIQSKSGTGSAPKYNMVAIVREQPADLETPVSSFLKLRRGSYSFLLESVEGGERVARYSIIGTEPYNVIRKYEKEGNKDPMVSVEEALAGIRLYPHPFLPITGGAIGYSAYDVVRYYEPRAARPQRDDLSIPESLWMFCDSLVVFDNVRHSVNVVAHCSLDGNIEANYERAKTRILELSGRLSGPLPLPKQEALDKCNIHCEGESNTGQEKYENFVRSIKARIVEGDVIQTVPSHRIKRPTQLHPFNIYRHLRTVNPSPYMFYFDVDDFQIVGASPELLVKVDKERKVYTHPIAGTRKRGTTEEEDEALAKELLGDEKERAEHVMLVDLGRNDIGRVAVPGTVEVDDFMHIEKYSHVMHIVSQVTGILADDKTMYDAFRAVFPAGTVSGAPKVMAMQIIAELEGIRRGVYSGAVGYFSYGGVMDTCIALRTLVYKDRVAYLQAGAGIVYDSDPTSEWEETMNKLRGLNSAINQAESFYLRLGEESREGGEYSVQDRPRSTDMEQ